MERQKFEDSLKKAFEEAGVSPSENVWTNIELDLEKAKGETLKKRLLFYQMLAAACVMIAVGVSVGVYVRNDNVSDSLSAQLANQPQQSAEKVAPLSSTPADREASTSNSKRDINADRSTDLSGKKIMLSREVNASSGESPATLENVNTMSNERTYASRPLPVLVDERRQHVQLALVASQPEVDPVALMLAQLAKREEELGDQEEKDKQKHNQDERIWTSIGFAAGSFSSSGGVSANNSNPALAMASNVANQEAKASGVSYSMGLNVGTRVSDRWVVQGGLNYLSQSSDYTTRNAVGNFDTFKPASINELEKLSTDNEFVSDKQQLMNMAPYNVNNNSRYLNIPVQAGYLVIDRTFGLQVNAGVSTDLFLQNTVTAEGKNMGKTTQAVGEDSPYRSVNFSGLVGTEFSYRFGPHYRIALNPGIRYPFNSIYKSDLDIRSTPLSFDVGLRFRYIFH